MRNGNVNQGEVVGFSEKRLAEIWCLLNRWEIPKELKEKFNKESYDSGEVMGAMKLIELLIGKKKCLKQWNLKK